MGNQQYACTYEYADRDGDRILVYRSFDYKGLSEAEIHVEDNVDTLRTNYAYLPRENAPAFALAVLEAAGYAEQGSMSMNVAVAALRGHVLNQTLRGE